MSCLFPELPGKEKRGEKPKMPSGGGVLAVHSPDLSSGRSAIGWEEGSRKNKEADVGLWLLATLTSSIQIHDSNMCTRPELQLSLLSSPQRSDL